MKQLLDELAQWLNAEGVTGNLIAWAVCGIPSIFLALWHHRRQLARDVQRFEHPRKQPPPAPQADHRRDSQSQ